MSRETRNSETSPRSIRRQLIVAPKAQGTLLFRIMLYCALTSILTGVLFLSVDSFATQWLSSNSVDVTETLPATNSPTSDTLFVRTALLSLSTIVALAVTMPFVMYDAAKVSNHIVGPFVRAHGAIRRLGTRDQVNPLEVRRDSWNEWTHDFNVMLARVQANTTSREHGGAA